MPLSNRDAALMFQRLPYVTLRELMPHMRELAGEHVTIRREFSSWVIRSNENFGSWQAAWNRWTHSSEHYNGSISLNCRCAGCNGRRFSVRTGKATLCPNCYGKGRLIVRTSTRWRNPYPKEIQ